MLNHRCTICNRVSSKDIQTNACEYKDVPFVPDTYGQGFICLDCKQSVESLLLDYEQDDDIWGWEYTIAEDEDDNDKIVLDNDDEE